MPYTIVLNKNNLTDTSTRDTGYHTLVYKFPNSVSFGNHEVAVQSVSMFYSWENINNTPLNNNQFQYIWFNGSTQTTQTVTIPNGLYEVDDINNYLQFYMISKGHYLINSAGQFVYYAEFVLSPTAYAVQLNTYPVPTSSGWTQNSSTGQWTGNSGTAYTGWTTPLANIPANELGWQGFPAQTYNPSIIMMSSSNFYKIIGFTSTFTSSLNLGVGTNLSYISTVAPQVNPNSVAYLSITNINNPYANPSSILYSISPTVAFGEQINEKPPQFCWSPLLQGTYNQLRVQLLGNDLQPLKILDPDMTIMLVIRETPRTPEGIGF